MERVTDQMAEHLCTLAQLSASEAQNLAIREDLEKILAHMAELDSVDTTDVDKYKYENNRMNRLRHDEISDSMPEVLSGAPQMRDGKIVVPKTF